MMGHQYKTAAFILLLGFVESSFAGDLSDPTVGLSEGTRLDLSLPSEVIEATSATSQQDFSGTWVLDHEASDNLKKIMKSARNSGGRSRSGGRKDGDFGRRPGGMGMPRGGNESRQKSGAEAMSELSAKTLEIVHQEPRLTITTEQHGTRQLYTDYRGATVSAIGGMDQQVVTGGWEGDVLVIEITSPGGRHIVQRLRLLEEPRSLERLTELPGRGKKTKTIQFRQIFLPSDVIGVETATEGKVDSSHFTWMED